MEFQIEQMLSAFQEQNLNVLYVQVRRAGEVIGEYQRTPKKARLNMYSVSKSVVSAGAGIAIAEGLLSLEDRVVDVFPEYVTDRTSKLLEGVQAKHLLTMSSGLKESLFFADSSERYTVKDWIQYFFDAEFIHPAGESFLYSNFNTYMLSCMIERRAGVNLLEYLRDRLFEPIGIGNPDWTLCPKGHVHAANGLFLNIDELAAFGELLRGYGNYKGKQIVSEEYIRAAVSRQVDGGDYGYGYQIWQTPFPGTFMCDGNYGQYCLIMPEQEMVFSVISFEGNYGKIKEILFACAGAYYNEGINHR